MRHSFTPQHLLLVRPAAFGFNTETSASNSFQATDNNDAVLVHTKALTEFNLVIKLLKGIEISVFIMEDTPQPKKPDALFPNNWISTHPDGLVITYPMMAPNRRLEKRSDVIDKLKEHFSVREVWDISNEEEQRRFLEGTGSIVFDHQNKIAYACRSPRTDEVLLKQLVNKIGYEAIVFNAVDENGKPIYHTNVMMWVGEKTAGLCLDAIKNDDDQELLINKLMETNHKLIALSYQQIKSFAGNMFEVKNAKDELFLLMSRTAFQSLLPGQLNEISRYAEPLVFSIETIEKYGGGSIRCMVAGIYLPAK
jgi:hypothetical protein